MQYPEKLAVVGGQALEIQNKKGSASGVMQNGATGDFIVVDERLHR
jgi:hypothetical protein